MGQNGWYISHPVVTLTAYDPQGKAQSGVNHTYYIIDSGTQQEYTAPFTVPGDGTHVVKYWSVDKAGNAEAQHTVPPSRSTRPHRCSPNTPSQPRTQ